MLFAKRPEAGVAPHKKQQAAFFQLPTDICGASFSYYVENSDPNRCHDPSGQVEGQINRVTHST
jgi:hypothetical protein